MAELDAMHGAYNIKILTVLTISFYSI